MVVTPFFFLRCRCIPLSPPSDICSPEFIPVAALRLATPKGCGDLTKLTSDLAAAIRDGDKMFTSGDVSADTAAMIVARSTTWRHTRL
mmetsp:Transcript_46024/g.46489  ORF Transcript_46024/g.46489 Transcript_46024/m.46489 type:complete len:88 (-) Transcript_46024:144-407(-)